MAGLPVRLNNLQGGEPAGEESWKEKSRVFQTERLFPKILHSHKIRGLELDLNLDFKKPKS